MNKKFLLFILFIFTILILTSCKEKKLEKKGAVEQIFYTVMPKKNFNLNPHTYTDENSRALIMQIFEGLTELKEGGTKLVSAKKIEHSEDFKKWSIVLRDDLKWSDGKKIDAQSFLDSWLKALQSENVSEEIHRFFVIENAEEIHLKKEKTNNLGVVATENTLNISLNTSVENFDEWLSNPIFFPIREENYSLEPKNLIVNAAFKIIEFNDNSLILEKNQNYWDNHNTRLKKVNINLVEDKIMAYEMFPRLEIDFFGAPFYRLPFERRKQVNSLPEKVEFKTNKYSYISFSEENSFFNLPEVKKELYAVTDPEFMGKVIIQNSSPSIFPHEHPSSKTVEEARDKFLKLKEENKFIYSDEPYVAYSETNKTLEKKLLVSTLKDWIGQFKMPIRVKSSLEIKPTFTFNTYILGTNDFKDFYYYINYKYQNSNKSLLIKNNEEFLEKLPVIPLNKIYTTILVHSNVQGLYINPSGDIYLKYIYIK